jgi:DivIVA domain-containing protein
MVLTPADVHNIAFSRPRIGKRGYNEQEVDLFIDLVEQELVRHLEEEGELRSCNAELRNRDGGLQQREAELCQREAALHQHEREVHQHEEHLRQQEAKLAQRAAQLAKQGTPLPQQVAQLRYREAQVAQREAQIAQHEAGHEQQEAKLAQRQAQLDQREAELREQQAELRRRPEQREAVASCVGAEAAPNQPLRPPRQSQQLRAVPKPAGVNGASRLEETRAAAPVHGRHDMERMAIRAVIDTLGNSVTEAVHERTRRTGTGNGGPDPAYDVSELELLKEENAALERSLGMLKSAAALVAAALERA